MKKWIRIIFVLVIVGLLAAFLVFKFYINKPHKDIAAAKPEYSLSAEGIWKEYTTDSKASGLKFDGKIVELVGTLSTVENYADTAMTMVFVMGKDPLFGDKSIRCEILPGWFNEAKTLKQGATVKVKGLVNGYDETDLKLGKCSLIK